MRCPGRLAIALLALVSLSSRAEVYVESTEAVVNGTTSVKGGTYIYYTLPLKAATTLTAKVSVTGGMDNAVQVYFLDLANFQLFTAGQQFNIWPESSPKIVGSGGFAFTVPSTNVYHLVVDNRNAFSPRNLGVKVERSTSEPTEAAKVVKEFFAAHYGMLRGLFAFDEFDIHIQSCGTPNAFSTPHIVLCRELLSELDEKELQQAAMFVFYHEAAHSLLNVWNYPLWDNEDAADELAVVMLMLIEQDEAALQAAQWWSQRDARGEAQAALVVDDRHTLSPQRARNIVNWLNKKDELFGRWFQVFIPHLTDKSLEAMATVGKDEAAETPQEAKVKAALENEVRSRKALRAANTSQPPAQSTQ